MVWLAGATVLVDTLMLGLATFLMLIDGATSQRWMTVALTAAGVLAAVSMCVLQRWNWRRRLRLLGRELVDDAGRVEAALTARKRRTAPPTFGAELRLWWQQVKAFPRPGRRG